MSGGDQIDAVQARELRAGGMTWNRIGVVLAERLGRGPAFRGGSVCAAVYRCFGTAQTRACAVFELPLAHIKSEGLSHCPACGTLVTEFDRKPCVPPNAGFLVAPKFRGARHG